MQQKIETFKTLIDQELLLMKDVKLEEMMDVCPTCFHIY